ncbi:MAG TPA: hypothetical protein H9874_09720 [Candidatus Bilophila faecipullorum]|uniref:Uncharacterized protein n=2 Tax=Bilophila TaxID=35832 RepID=A0A9D1R2Q6_9BACT|nr:hypothetical protein [uncultured Bilophila sp.]HIW79403.1 hypothetical protein [Candidatus Bilophila faecipullorum]
MPRPQASEFPGMGGVPLACGAYRSRVATHRLPSDIPVRPVARAAATGTLWRLHMIRADVTMMSGMPFSPTATVSQTEKRNSRA